MTSSSTVEYNSIQVTQPVSVIPVGEGRKVDGGYRVLIMGPTGSGKSSFIEALGLKGTSRISSNGLDGFTQAISAYRLNKVTYADEEIYLVDSPGFADSKISEMSIVTMLQKWMKVNGTFWRILYFTPITPVRLPGSQRHVLKTFQTLSGVHAAVEIIIVTTMWDNIWGERAATRAERTYEQLRDNIWKDFIKAGSQITRFYNTEQSALAILNDTFGQGRGWAFSIENHRHDIKGSPFANNLLTDLQDRIQNLHSHIPTLQDELAHAAEQGNELLVSTLRPRIEEAESDLARFSKELNDYGRPSSAPPSHTASTQDSEASGASSPSLSTQQSPTHSPTHSAIVLQDDDDSALAHTRGSSSSNAQSILNAHQAIRANKAVGSSSPGLEIPLPSQPTVQKDQTLPQQQPVPAQRAPGLFVRIMEILKCWGNAVGERHED